MSTPHEADTIGILCGLIASQLDLEAKQVTVYNQKKLLGQTSGILVDVDFLTSRPFGSSKTHDTIVGGDEDGQLEEVVGIQVQESYTIKIRSRDQSALARKWEIVAAFASDEAQRLQEQYTFRLSTLPVSFVDLSTNDGPARLNVYAITVTLLRAYEKRRLVESYNDFSGSPALYLDPVSKLGDPIILPALPNQ